MIEHKVEQNKKIVGDLNNVNDGLKEKKGEDKKGNGN